MRRASVGQRAPIRTAAPITEKQFQQQVTDLAKVFGWDFIYHPQLSKWSESGWPDLFLLRVRDRRAIFAELKRDGGRLTERQSVVLEFLECLAEPRCGPANFDPAQRPMVEVFVWRPSDLEAITAVLR